MITLSATQDNECEQGYLPAHAEQYIIVKHTNRLKHTKQKHLCSYLFIFSNCLLSLVTHQRADKSHE